MGLEMNGGRRWGGGGLPPGASYDDEPPIDLSLLRRGRPGEARSAADWEALAARIERAAEPELARRARATSGVLDFIPVLARSVRPALIAAAAALLLAVGLVPRETPVESTELAATPSVIPAADVVVGQLLSDASDERPVVNPDAAWIAQQRAPSTTALAAEIGLADLGDIP
jgi:hypothetical protein